jgi:molybdopterin-containing oxidoreductase family iron-sulfur binding subunit
MASNKKYWKSVDELTDENGVLEALSQKEFVEEIPTDQFLGNKEALENSSTSRRDFLKFVGFSTAAATVASCQGPVVKSIPYVVKPEDVLPGEANYYATTIADGFDFANILVKVREGRPIKIEPNKDANGATNARVQASVLSLYDSNRLKGAYAGGKEIAWDAFNKAVIADLDAANTAGKQIVILTGTCASPSSAKLFKAFVAKYPTAKHIVSDTISESGMLDAMQAMYGDRSLPSYDFSKAKTIVSFGADFLGDWQGGGNNASYAKGRQVKYGKMSQHHQFEANMSLTGASADYRYPTKPSEQIFALINLYNKVTGSSLASKKTSVDATIAKLAEKLKNGGLVVVGANDKNAQLIALAINKALFSQAIDVKNTRNVRKGNDTQVQQLLADMKAGKVGAIITNNTNPVYSIVGYADAAKNVKTSVAISLHKDETAATAKYVAGVNHYLESWGDVAIDKATVSIMQPVIKPLFNTKQFQDLLLAWTGNSTSYYAFLKANKTFASSWNTAVHDGFAKGVVLAEEVSAETVETTVDLAAAAKALGATKTGKFELSLYSSVAIGDGKQANNPWLQEFTDPLTRIAWDNYLTVSAKDAKTLGFKNPVQDNGAIDGNYATVTVNGVSQKVPVFVQPGQAEGTVGLAFGYGRTAGIKEAMAIGVNAYAFYNNAQETQIATIAKADGNHQFACVQIQNTIAGRTGVLRETTLGQYLEDRNKAGEPEWNEKPKFSMDHQEVGSEKADLWTSFDRSIGHHFNLSIDLTGCTGCGACVIACQAENNVPVVGKDEVRKSRDMQWLRIDRYYSSVVSTQEEAREEGLSVSEMYQKLEEVATENPQVAFQPLMCQHCNHAPCETVCPVAATSHGRQGQNMMAYNRCVGTRYCANNCPYRVRRFNWFRYNLNEDFDFNMNDDYGRMVLNPDVVVRSRGVMEKCSMCIQKTQATILKAKKENRKVNTNEFETACSTACSAGAMQFGDVNNEKDAVASLAEDKRAYHLLDFIGTKPNVVYQSKIRNIDNA